MTAATSSNDSEMSCRARSGRSIGELDRRHQLERQRDVVQGQVWPEHVADAGEQFFAELTRPDGQGRHLRRGSELAGQGAGQRAGVGVGQVPHVVREHLPAVLALLQPLEGFLGLGHEHRPRRVEDPLVVAGGFGLAAAHRAWPPGSRPRVRLGHEDECSKDWNKLFRSARVWNRRFCSASADAEPER